MNLDLFNRRKVQELNEEIKRLQDLLRNEMSKEKLEAYPYLIEFRKINEEYTAIKTPEKMKELKNRLFRFFEKYPITQALTYKIHDMQIENHNLKNKLQKIENDIEKRVDQKAKARASHAVSEKNKIEKKYNKIYENLSGIMKDSVKFIDKGSFEHGNAPAQMHIYIDAEIEKEINDYFKKNTMTKRSLIETCLRIGIRVLKEFHNNLSYIDFPTRNR